MNRHERALRDFLFENATEAYDKEGRHSEGIMRVIESLVKNLAGHGVRDVHVAVLDALPPEEKRDFAATLIRDANTKEGYEPVNRHERALLEFLFNDASEAYDKEGRHSEGIMRVVESVVENLTGPGTLDMLRAVLDALPPEEKRDLAATLIRDANTDEGYKEA